jgi:folate-dependent phosphoribosylglycinamide formyltransferase PurN
VTAEREPLRVVIFTGGAVLEDACVELMARIRGEPSLVLAGVFCEAGDVGLRGMVRDLVRRRRWLAPILLVQRALRRLGGILAAPGRELARRRVLRDTRPLVHFVPDLHAGAVLEHVRALAPDVGAVYGGPILRRSLFEVPARGTLGIHHGRLPDYRGKKTTFWAVYNGEATVGVAIQRIGAGLDCGDVLRDALLPVGRRPLPVLVRELERLGLDLYVDALLSIQHGDAVFRPQPSGRAPLYRDPRAVDVMRFWLKDLSRLLRPGVRALERGRSP